MLEWPPALTTAYALFQNLVLQKAPQMLRELFADIARADRLQVDYETRKILRRASVMSR
jgi:hypothetical protein